MSRATVGACGRFVCVLVCLFGLALESGRTQSPPPPATLVPVSAGATHSLAIDASGAIWSWGSNIGGVLGDGTLTPRRAPVPVSGAVGVFTQVAAGGTHSLARRTDGRIVAWGANSNGEVGNGSTTPRLTPVVLAAPTDVVAVAAGGNHSLALRSDGTLVGWGLNNEGQLGDNTRTRRLSPVPVNGLTNVIAIAAGGLHSLALTADGRVFSWGAGNAGQLGHGTTSRRLVPTPIASLSGVVAISAGAFHSAAVTATGALAVWGNNATYQLGDSTQTPRLSPVLVPGLTGVTGVSAGAGHTLAMTSSQSLYAWGSNLGSQLGDGTNTTRPSPVAVTPPAAVSALAAGGAHSVVLAGDASVWAAGTNLLGQVGDGSFSTATRFVPISGPGQTWGVFPPSLTPSGGTFSAPQTITTSTPTAGATVHYTTTGTDPVAADPTWPSEGLTLAAPTTLKVRGFKVGMTPSTVTTGVYAFAVNPPIATPSGGTYTTPQTVSLSSTTPGATITYSLDGSDPTEGSAVYGAPFVVSTSSTLKVRAFRAGWQPSAMLSYVYTFNLGTLATPTAVPPAGTYSAPQTVMLSAEPGATIRYTLGGVDPTEASPAYAAPIAVASTTVLKARAYRPDWTPSAILTASYAIETNSEPLPPDPSTVATPINPATITDFAEANAFLYAGPDPIQRGATASAFDPRRLAIVRGRVLDRAGQPLSGARIAIADNVAFGYTLSRADGLYDMAVNGGGAVVVDIERPGYLPVQRRVETQWHAWRWADDVRLTPLDPVATAVRFDAGAPPQRARGSLVSDENGPRQATVIVPEGGVSANLELADGSVLPNQAQLTLRATEYTVGAAGPEAMPGELPGTSGYTYAVDLTADEAVQAGAVRVTFDPALVFYVDNFLDFPVGGSVPAGSYDRAAAAWVAEGNGRIVRILEPDGTGTAQLDIDGTGNPATPEALTALGVTLGERQQLSALYQPGKSLWRVPMAHFSPWDCNWPYGPPSDLVRSSLGTPFSDRQDDDPCEEGGSIIECQNQTLGERLPIAGTPFTLNYRSNRQPGRAATRGLTIPLTGAVVGGTFFGGTLDVQVAGQRIRQSFGASPNQTTNVIWDGRDVYGREVEGAQPASVTVRHDYPAEYQEPAELDRNFALPSGSSVLAANRTRGVFTFTQHFGMTLGGASTPSAPIGGWSLDVHHTYDPKSRTLYLGDGSRRTDVAPGPTIRTAAGGGQAQPNSTRHRPSRWRFRRFEASARCRMDRSCSPRRGTAARPRPAVALFDWTAMASWPSFPFRL